MLGMSYIPDTLNRRAAHGALVSCWAQPQLERFSDTPTGV
jgi:hypothetical protein